MTPQPASITGTARTCLNGLTHGGASQSLFIRGDNPDDFYTLLETNFAEYRPFTMQYAGFVTDTTLARWFLWRRQQVLATAEMELHTNKPNPAEWTLEDLHRIDVFTRYCIQAERALRRSFINAQALTKETTQEVHWQAALDLAKQRFALETERFRFTQQVDARHALQQEAEGELAAKRAQKSLQVEREMDDVKERMASHPFEEKAAVWQTTAITTSQGVTEVELLKSNQAVREEIAARAGKRYPPKIVVRCFDVKGPLPAEYEWLKREPALKYKDGVRAYRHPMYFATFDRVTAIEDAAENSLCLCHFPYESAEINQEAKAA